MKRIGGAEKIDKTLLNEQGMSETSQSEASGVSDLPSLSVSDSSRTFTPDEFKAIVDVFKILKKWRDELESSGRRSGHSRTE
jgi:hypothetical protein